MMARRYCADIPAAGCHCPATRLEWRRPHCAPVQRAPGRTRTLLATPTL